MRRRATKKVVSVAKLKSIGDGRIPYEDSKNSIIPQEDKLDKVLGFLKYRYYLFLRQFAREPVDIEDLFDGINFFYFYNTPKEKW